MNWSFSFGSPWWLFLLALLPLIFYLSRKSVAGLSPVRRWAALALRGFVVLLLVCAMAELQFLRRDDRLVVFYLVDRSDSIPLEKKELARQFVVETATDREDNPDDAVGAIAFGKVPGVEVSAKKEDLYLESFNTVIEPESTDIAGAIRLAVAAFPEGVGKRIVLLSDGNETRGDVLEEVYNAREQGVTIDVVPLTYSYRNEIAIEKLLVDPEQHVGEPFTVRVVISSTHATEVDVQLFENDTIAAGDQRTVPLIPGKNVVDFKARRLHEVGPYYYSARLQLKSSADDSLPQNNSAYAFTVISGEPKVLLCTADRTGDSSLINALREDSITLDVLAPQDMPRRVEDYFPYDGIIVSNVRAEKFSTGQMKMFMSLVKTVGLGFIMIGGEDSFGAGSYQGTSVETLLPVEMEIKQKKVLPNGALAMIVHSCELSNGNFWARQVVQRAIDILAPRDYAGVLYYDGMGGSKWLFPMWPITRRRQMHALLSNFNPGDMPSFDPIMNLALRGLRSTRASIKHMIILSDGDPTLTTMNTVNAITAAGVTITTICYGAHGGVPQIMPQLAKLGGGRFYHLTSAAGLPEIFIRETATITKSLIVEESFEPIVREFHPVLKGVGRQPPQLDGLVLTQAKELAAVPIVRPSAEDPTDDPLLAIWSFGVGKSLAFTSDAGKRWASQWASWRDYRQFWGQCVRWVMRPRSDNRFRVTRTLEDGKARVVIDAMTVDGRYVNGLKFNGQVVSPGEFDSADAIVRQTAPGRYLMEAPVSKKGTHTVSLSYEEDGVQRSLVTGVSVPYSQEYRQLRANTELLQRIAEASGGEYRDDLELENPSNVAFFRRGFEIPWRVDSGWSPLLMLALFLFFADVFARRVAIDYRETAVQAWRKVVALAKRKPVEVPQDKRLSALLERKAELRKETAARVRTHEEVVSSHPPETGGHAVPTGDTAASMFSLDAQTEAEKKKAKPKPPAPAAKKEADDQPEAGSYTARLLAAKRRALQKDEDKDKDDARS